MITKLEIIFIFEVLSTSKSNDVITETKLQRGHTVASTAVIFRHRLDVDSSDPLLLFHSNHNLMLSTNDESNQSHLENRRKHWVAKRRKSLGMGNNI